MFFVWHQTKYFIMVMKTLFQWQNCVSDLRDITFYFFHTKMKGIFYSYEPSLRYCTELDTHSECCMPLSKPLVICPVNQSVDQPVWLSACQRSSRRQLGEADQIRPSPCGRAEKHCCHCNHSSSVNLASPTTAWPRGHPLESMGGWEGAVLRGSVLCLRRCHSGSSWCPGRIRYRGEATLTEKDGGHQTPTQSSLHLLSFSLSKGKQFNKNCARDSSDARYDAKPKALQPSDIDKTPSSHWGRDFMEMLGSWFCLNAHQGEHSQWGGVHEFERGADTIFLYITVEYTVLNNSF